MTTATSKTSAPFPGTRAGRMQTPAMLAEHGFSLRPARDDDVPWLRDLYVSTRADEMAQVPWPETAKRAFLDHQFNLQHLHFLKYVDTDFMAIGRAGYGPVGRFYLQRSMPTHRIVDIALFPAARGQGIGSALIRDSQACAASVGATLDLHVLKHNAGARRLYSRLGFLETGDAGSHVAMRWTSAVLPTR